MGEVLAYTGKREDASSIPGLVEAVLRLSRAGLECSTPGGRDSEEVVLRELQPWKKNSK